MRFLPFGVVAVVIMTAPAFALSGGDSMQAWAGASTTEKNDLLRKLEAGTGGEASRDRVRSCLDETATTAGHSSLPVSDVAKACSERAARENI